MQIKILLITVFLFSSQSLFSQMNVEDLFLKFSKETEVKKIKLGSFVLGISSLFTDTKGLKRIEIFDLSECNSAVVEDYRSSFLNLQKGDYEAFITHNEKGNKTRIYLKTRNDAITEFLVLMAGEDADFIMRLTGKIKFSDINNLMQKYAN